MLESIHAHCFETAESSLDKYDSTHHLYRTFYSQSKKFTINWTTRNKLAL